MTVTIARPARRVGLQVALLIMVFVSLAPIAVILSISLKTNTELATNPLGLPQQWLFSNFAEAWNEAGIGRYILNSILVAVPTLIIVVVVASLAGYAFAMMRFRGREALFTVFLIGLMLPAVSIVIALSFVQQNLGLYDTLPGLILAEAAMCIPLAVFIMRAAFRDLPHELREAVFIDGGSELTAFLRVMFPLARPAVSATVVLTFLTVWNDYLIPLVLINTESLRTVPLGLAFLKTSFTSDIVLIAASTALAALPSILIYVLLQRQFIQGIAQGSIK
ncbi:MAG: sugar ABC transporter permease [Microbacterium sp.]|uniref:carbohydrate ABC transporter permease n=1 Tax=Microbacterium sp. TaxID=51671 RepID=UPI000DB56165|nr:carbohydrate ABC transporter permease [Microbacterium sp.]PZU41662.1 MAG: sugar ABC transporter permease [Microbacterium sp.]